MGRLSKRCHEVLGGKDHSEVSFCGEARACCHTRWSTQPSRSILDVVGDRDKGTSPSVGMALCLAGRHLCRRQKED